MPNALSSASAVAGRRSGHNHPDARVELVGILGHSR